MPADRRNPKRAAPTPARRELWLPVLLFITVLAAFLPCLQDGFIQLDDPAYVSNNPHMRHGLTWASFKWAWTSAESTNWHPVTWLSHLLDAQFFGLNPAGHHATNVLIHALNTLLLFLLLRKMTGARWRSFIVAALFGLHPLRVESVAWISERKDVLSVLFWMLMTWSYLRYVEEIKSRNSNAKIFYGLSLLLFALGLLAKSMLVTLPFALLLLEYWPLRRWSKSSALRLVLEKLPFLVLAAADSAVTYLVQEHSGAVTPGDTLSLSARLANAVVSYVRYLGKLAWPVDLCAMYVHPGHWPVGTVAGAGLVLAAITVIALWRVRDMPYLAVGWFWFLGTLVPVIGIIQVGRQAIADRYTYIPCIGILMAVVWLATKLSENWRNQKNIARIAVGAACLACIALTVRQIDYWKDTKTLFSHARDVTKNNWVATAYLAYGLQLEGKVDEAAAMYQESLQINPGRTEIRCKLANMFLDHHRYNEALAQFQQAVALDSTDFDSHMGMGATLQNMGRLDEAIEQFNQAVQLKPDAADAYSNLGNCFGMKGRTDDAVRCFEQAVKLQPKSAQNHLELGVGLANKRLWDASIDQFKQALQLEPANVRARQNLEAAVQAKMNSTPAPTKQN